MFIRAIIAALFLMLASASCATGRTITLRGPSSAVRSNWAQAGAPRDVTAPELHHLWLRFHASDHRERTVIVSFSDYESADGSIRDGDIVEADGSPWPTSFVIMDVNEGALDTEHSWFEVHWSNGRRGRFLPYQTQVFDGTHTPAHFVFTERPPVGYSQPLH